MTESELYYLAGKCLVLEERPEFKHQLIQLCKNDLIDWITFIKICSENLVLPAIYLKLRAQKIFDYMPEEVVEHLSEIYELNKKRNIEILHQIKSITALLKAENIVPLYMKGAGNLLDDIYSDVGERVMGDIDFLVPEQDFLTAAVAMLDAGYLSWSDTTKITIRDHQHYPRIYHPDFVADVELHRIPNEYKCDNWFNAKMVLDEKKRAGKDGGCFVESDKHKIIHNFIHSQLDHQGFSLGKVLLRDIYDVYLTSRRISLNDLLPEIKTKKKAIAYFAFTDLVFGAERQIFHKQNFAFQTLKTKRDLNLNSNIFYKTNKALVVGYTNIRYQKGYFGMFIEAFHSKEMRQFIFHKLTSRSFYRKHFKKVQSELSDE
ncbi:Uncharacterised nucleotidyltransferase [Mariniphaga anaerophila]|uniref:Uncharacterized nucleotidyltransferase n=1 Tax=Mariniphaga anaerophila TaxID=1484053 RepID=A0A1M5AJX7_9BACT|nr:nucleotidyltransferase family protein [Mariniphaga anaerophila]SHF30444.1 Uncharacterised nucleotidyltransferase [Mariniphaga anaerophila]